MARFLLIALTFLAACSNRPSSPSHERQQQTRYYDYTLSTEFLNPFLGLERSYTLNADTLTILNNAFSKEGKLTKTDSISLTVTKPQLDTIYAYAEELFAIERENSTDVPILRPPDGEGNMARVTFDLTFRGDRYVRDVH